MNVCQEHGSKPCMTTPAHGWQRALVISGGYWLTAGRYQSWLHGGAQRIWMRQQQNGFASPSLSFSLRKAEWECQRDTRLPTTPEDTVATLQKSINKKKLQKLPEAEDVIVSVFFPRSVPSFTPFQEEKKKKGTAFLLHLSRLWQSHLTFTLRHWAHLTQFQAGWVWEHQLNA